jgi:hypothetical protein
MARFPYHALPPIPMQELRGDFTWLPKQVRSPGATGGWSEESRREWFAQFAKLGVQAEQLGLKLPAPFLKYMLTDLRLRADLNSCWGPLQDWIAESPKGERGRLFAFTTAGQGGLVWYLYLMEGVDDHCVVVSCDCLGFNNGSEPQFPEQPENVYYCAPSFEAFVYRSWIEWEISWALTEEKRPLSKDEQAYADHWQRYNCSTE